MMVLVMVVIYIYSLNGNSVRESITYFPIDPSITYDSTNTTLTLLGKGKEKDDYLVNWAISSSLDRKAYLRQDVGFLYVNGRLKGKLGEWKQNTEKLSQEVEVVGKDSSLYQAITFHHSEIHMKQDEIFSAQQLSADQLYIIDSSFSPLRSFRVPVGKEELEWKSTIDNMTSKQLQSSWAKALEAYSINRKDYFSFPLTEMIRFNEEALPGFSTYDTQKIIGNLWEGIYKNYFLGIKEGDQTIINPFNSSVPLILLANDKSHLLVVFEASTGEPFLLRQQITTDR